ncbi:MAPK-interacting and spindle-stabilizing protein-like [Calypte anna]|uniref:MAPK-interacting and spindle-stabilizing protein-like n=1 Tax=Calypte anna TaxID=9244 RepID=UPI0011C36888|nr:MAPK-interacting and spindle-stabilizing protein-like [Calypte anna]
METHKRGFNPPLAAGAYSPRHAPQRPPPCPFPSSSLPSHLPPARQPRSSHRVSSLNLPSLPKSPPHTPPPPHPEHAPRLASPHPTFPHLHLSRAVSVCEGVTSSRELRRKRLDRKGGYDCGTVGTGRGGRYFHTGLPAGSPQAPGEELPLSTHTHPPHTRSAPPPARDLPSAASSAPFPPPRLAPPPSSPLIGLQELEGQSRAGPAPAQGKEEMMLLLLLRALPRLSPPSLTAARALPPARRRGSLRGARV